MSHLDKRRMSALRALKRRHGMMPDQIERMNAQINGLDDWRVYCHECGMTIHGTPAFIRDHAEEHRGA